MSNAMRSLNVVAIASSEDVRTHLYNHLKALSWVNVNGVFLELSDAVIQCQQSKPDVIIVDFTDREMDAGLFVQNMKMNPQYGCALFALHCNPSTDVILNTFKSGAQELIHFPDELAKMEMALQNQYYVINRDVGTTQAAQEGTHGKILTVFSAKGGGGSSVMAVNLAYELQELHGKSVALLDLDQVFTNASLMLNLQPHYSLGDLTTTNPEDVDQDMLNRVLVTHESGLRVIVASKNVMDDHDLISPELLSKTMDYLIANFDYVVVDLPTHVLDPYHQYMIERSEWILLIAALDIPSLARTRQYMDLARRHLDLSKVKLILNRWNLKAAYGMSNESVEQQFGYPVFARIPNDWEACVESNSLGKTFGQIRPNSDIRKALKKLAQELLGEESQTSNTPSKKQGSGLLAQLIHSIKKPSEATSHVIQ